MSTQDASRTEEVEVSGPSRTKRRRKLIKGKLQLRLAATFGGLSMLALLFQTLIFGVILAKGADSMAVGGEYLLDLVPTLVGLSIAFSFGVVLPLTVAVGIVCSFRLVGPVYRFEQFLGNVIRGRQVEPCKIREKDAFGELCDLINRATEPLRGQSVDDGPRSAVQDEDSPSAGSRTRAAS